MSEEVQGGGSRGSAVQGRSVGQRDLHIQRSSALRIRGPGRHILYFTLAKEEIIIMKSTGHRPIPNRSG